MNVIRKNMSIDPLLLMAVQNKMRDTGFGSRGFSPLVAMLLRRWLDEQSQYKVAPQSENGNGQSK